MKAMKVKKGKGKGKGKGRRPPGQMLDDSSRSSEWGEAFSHPCARSEGEEGEEEEEFVVVMVVGGEVGGR